MKTPRLAIGFPLLVKELTELAARKRTYYVRVGYALLLFISALLVFWAEFYWRTRISGNALGMLGRGRSVFVALVYLQFAGIYLFLPAMISPVIAGEKERDSFSLLLLTRLGPWTIIFEKLLGRLIPMFTFLLLALPLMAYAYTYGGVEQQQIWGAIILLGITALQVASFCLMCSAYFRTTVAAFVGAYLIFSTVFFAIPGILAGSQNMPEEKFMFFLGPVVYGEVLDWGIGGNIWLELLLRCIPLVGSTLLFLGLTRYYLIRRAFSPPRHLLRRLFQSLDGIYTKFNQNRITRGVVLIADHSSLPMYRPVSWRETEKRNLGQFRYLLRIFLSLEIPVVLVIVSVISRPRNNPRIWELCLTLFVLWILAVLIVAVQSSSLISGERSRQTLDVLLATPLSGSEIILQKMQGLRRVSRVLSACFLTIILFEVWWYSGFQGTAAFADFNSLRYLIGSLLSLLVCLPLVAWLSLWISLKVKSQGRAIVVSIFTLCTWCGVPVFLTIYAVDVLQMGKDAFFIFFLAPSGMIFLNEIHDFPHFGSSIGNREVAIWILVLANYAFYGFIVWRIRAHCLRHADRYLGRREEGPESLLPPQNSLPSVNMNEPQDLVVR